MKTLRNLLACTTVSIGLMACASSGDKPVVGSAASADVAEVVVTNRNWQDVTVYAVRQTVRQRLGTVTSMSTARFKIPNSMLRGTSTIRLEADPIGSTHSYVTDAVSVWPGERIEFNIENLITTSSLSVWNR